MVVGAVDPHPNDDWHPKRRRNTIISLVASLASILAFGLSQRQGRQGPPDAAAPISRPTSGQPVSSDDGVANVIAWETERAAIHLPCTHGFFIKQTRSSGELVYLCDAGHAWIRQGEGWVKAPKQ